MPLRCDVLVLTRKGHSINVAHRNQLTLPQYASLDRAKGSFCEAGRIAGKAGFLARRALPFSFGQNAMQFADICLCSSLDFD